MVHRNKRKTPCEEIPSGQWWYLPPNLPSCYPITQTRWPQTHLKRRTLVSCEKWQEKKPDHCHSVTQIHPTSKLSYQQQTLFLNKRIWTTGAETYHGKDSKAEDSITDTKDHAKRLQDTDNLIGHQKDPCDSDHEPCKTERSIESWWRLLWAEPMH